jgi:hypothetical protein
MGWKVFDKSLKCRDFQFEIGKTYEEKEAVLCRRGFHFHENQNDLFNYYDFTSDNVVCEVECENVITGYDKSVCKKITIVKQLSWDETLNLINSGKGNTGRRNSGDKNSGDKNSGDENSGVKNSGDKNSGDENSGVKNSGDKNSGVKNSGDKNSGYGNSGDGNSGDRNSGDENSGNRNSGYGNSGDENSGNRNSGNRNSGDVNSCNYSSGYFNSEEQTVYMFNKDTGLKRSEIEIPYFCLRLTYFVPNSELEPDEQNENVGGAYKKRSYKDAWKKLIEEKPKLINDIKKLPNFDPGVFEEITGVKI